MTLALMIFTATCFVIARVLENDARVAAQAPAPAPANPLLADARAVLLDFGHTKAEVTAMLAGVDIDKCATVQDVIKAAYQK